MALHGVGARKNTDPSVAFRHLQHKVNLGAGYIDLREKSGLYAAFRDLMGQRGSISVKVKLLIFQLLECHRIIPGQRIIHRSYHHHLILEQNRVLQVRKRSAGNSECQIQAPVQQHLPQRPAPVLDKL